MVRGSQRTRFTGSSLIRLLAHLADADNPPASQQQPRQQQPAFAERLSQWLTWTDAVALSGALKGAGAPASVPSAAPDAAPEEREVARVRAALAKTLTEDGSAPAAKGRLKPALPAPSPKPKARAPDTDFAAHRQRYLAHQHLMHTRIGPLRTRVRAALERSASPALARLAAVDAVMEQAVDPHEQALLARVPALLERRFERLRTAARGSRDESAGAAEAHAEPAWLTTFTHDMHAVLLAELDLRLQPVEGLLEALRTPTTP